MHKVYEAVPYVVTDDTTKEFFQRIVDTQNLVALFDFENRDGLFPHVARQLKFALVTLGTAAVADVVFFAYAPADLEEQSKHVHLTPADIAAVNPNTRTCPTFRSRRDADINIAMYRRAGILWLNSALTCCQRSGVIIAIGVRVIVGRRQT
jgi:hypothetical protein